MSTVAFHRSARRPAPQVPAGSITVPAPSAIAAGGRSRWTHIVMVVPMLAGTVATALLFAGRQGGAYSYVVGGVFGLSSLGMLATSMASGAGRQTRIDVAGVRRDYAVSLADVRQRIRAAVIAQRAALYYRHPPPTVLVTLVDSDRLWERRRGDADFGAVRVGLGPQALTTSLVPEPGTSDDLDPIGLAAMRRLITTYGIVPSLPVAIATSEFARIRIDDPGMVRALLAQLAFAHSPEDQLIAVCASPERAADWEYLKWLPHHHHPDRADAAGPMRLAATSLGDLESLLGPMLDGKPNGRRTVVVIDDGDPTAAKRLTSPDGVAGCCIISLDAGPADVTLTVGPDGHLFADDADMGRPDTLSATEATALARALASFRLVEERAGTAEVAGAITLDGLLHIDAADGDLAQAVIRARGGRSAADRLRVPIGVQTSGAPVLLDLKEAARDGMGPHGLLIGATGSGKSELLRTLVLGLAASHDSASLNFVLIDFKGGATFASLDRLPHTAAVITNLVDELPLVDRMTDALNGELVRRQEVLRGAGNLASLHDYERARRADPTLDPLPVLLIVCDEFSELLSAKPDFIDLFVAIGRLGRSLGVHLLLASQRLDEGRLRGLDTHLSYRIGLRTFSAMESRSVLGVPDAYELPRSPGHGFLKSGTDALVRFKAAYASGPYARTVVAAPTPAPATSQRFEILPFTSTPVRSRVPSAVTNPTPTPTPPNESTPVQSLLEAMTDAMTGLGVPAHQVWLPPLSTSEPLDAVLGLLEPVPARGLTVADELLRGTLRVPVAIIDKPFEQRREPLWLALDAAAGHVAIVGGPQSGKSTLLRTLVCGLSLTHTPAETTFYCLDFGGGSLGTLRDLPHVGGVVGRLAADAVRRTVGEMATLLATRERQFADAGIDSIGAARRLGTVLGSHGDVFLVIDGWATARSDYDDLEPLITDIATRGLSYGVHVVVTASRWADLRPALRDLLGSRLELRLGDPSDSQVGRKVAANVPAHAPGRGLTTDERHFLTIAPRLAAESTSDLVKAIAAGWDGPKAPAVRELPALVPYAQVAAADVGALEVPIGIAEADLQPVSIDFATDPHLLVFGEPSSGKSSALRAIAGAIIARYTPEQARIVVIDYRRSMLGEIDGDHLIGYATSDGPAATLLGSVGEYMQLRLPGADVTPRELRARSWWTGPECFVLVDDYDLVTAVANPLATLLEYLSQANDIGLHVVVARRSGGAARAMFEPVLARLRELATPGLILSGDRDEGALVGTVRPRPLPPGRATLVNRRHGARLVQLGYLAPVDET